ncbi:Basement membrane-specific heparan sulfate proteoglycan core protein, partial [Schistosoma japonicum]
MLHETPYDTFVYERKETQIIEGVLGEQLTITCNPTKSQITTNNKSLVWYKFPGLKINGQFNTTLYINNLTINDLGTYFCSEYTTSLQHHLPVQRIEVWSNNLISEINFARLISSTNHRYYQCPNIPNENTFVMWEYPIGSLIVNEYSDKLERTLKLHSKKHTLPICQYNWIDQVNTLTEEEGYLKRVRRLTELTPYITISRRIDPDDPTVILQCHMPSVEAESYAYNYQWSTVESGKIGDSETIVRQIIVDHLPDDGVKKDTSITCEVSSSETGESVGSIKLDLEPKPIGTTGKMELSESTTEIYSYRIGESLELHCEIDKDSAETGSDVIWSFNGGTLPVGTHRLDKLRTSIIVIKEMENIHEGLYECQQKTRKLRGHILQAPTIVTIKILPEEDERWANAGDISEFHCRLDGREHGNQLIDWYFIPDGGDREISLHNDVKIDNPDATPSTSFLSIINVQKYHEGLYVCRALNLKDTAKLIVKTRGLTVTPDEVKARPGTTVQFLCELSSINGMQGGKVFWMRTDRHDLRPGKEEVIGTNGGRALLIVKDVGRFDHNITYMCTDGYSKDYGKLYVQEVCAPGYRPCGAQECLEETKFCDGVIDCEDGYDEIPSKCIECGANENVCGIVNDVKPLKNCYLQFWHCDGEDDCGNNFDESNCPAPSEYDKCNGTHYFCPQGDKMIARAFMCDSVPDCEPNGDDESECSYPSIIEPSGETHLIGHQSGNLTLTCVAYGRPPPTISWRYNWGHIRDGIKYSINYTVTSCNMAVSHLTLSDLESRASGLYTCEAVNRGRALAPDFLVNVAKGGLCKTPQFNDAAWFDDMCLSCYCSNVTDKCTSVKGYRKSPHDKSFNFNNGPITLNTYNKDGSIEEGQGVTEIDGDILRIPDVPNEATFVESNYSLAGSWVTSYGYDVKLNIRLFGESFNYLHGPFIILH